MSDLDLIIAQAKSLQKSSFVAAPPSPKEQAMMEQQAMMAQQGGGGMPMDPAMMQGGGGGQPPMPPQQGGMPMDPAMMQGGPPPMPPPAPLPPELEEILGNLMEGLQGLAEAIPMLQQRVDEQTSMIKDLEKRVNQAEAQNTALETAIRSSLPMEGIVP